MGVPHSEDCCDDVEIAAEVEWSNILNVPSYITTDWSVDQGDTNIDANNIPLLSYAPNTLAANGTPGLSNFNFNQTRKRSRPFPSQSPSFMMFSTSSLGVFLCQS